MRQIDRLPDVLKRPKKMQILCLGLSRTGTYSMLVALQQLGYTPYHGSQLFAKPEARHSKCWEEGLTARYYTGNTYGILEFDKLLGNYDAVTDCPCANFAEELISAYPDAKVILTTRDPDRWIQSMESCYYRILSMLSWHPIVYIDRNGWGAFQKLVYIILTDLTSGDWRNRTALRRGFLKHNEGVRSLVPKERFLDFQVEQGWGPLCRFLEKPEPASPFPKTNEGTSIANATQMVCWAVFWQKLRQAVPTVVAMSVAILAGVVWKMTKL